MYLNNYQKDSKRKFAGEPPDNPYIKMRFKLESLLGSSKENVCLSEHGALISPKPQAKNVQEQLLKELEQFHEYYINRYAALKGEYDRLSQQLRESSCTDFKQLMEQKQLEIERLAVSVQQAECEKQRMRMQYTSVLDKKNQEITELRSSCQMYHQRLQQKSINPYNSSLSSSNQNASNDPSLHRFYESLHESFRERSKHDQLKYQEEIKQLKTQVEEAAKSRMAVQSRLDSLTNENSSLQLKLREFEIEKKYQAERIKNATFELQVQLKVKEEALKKSEEEIEQLRNVKNNPQIKQTLREGSESQTSLPMKGTSDLNNYFTDEGVQAILSGREKPTLKIGDTSFKAAFFQQRKSLTNQVMHLPLPEQMTQKKKDRVVAVHRRNLSSTLNNSPKDLAASDSLNRQAASKLSSHDLKIKIFRLEKMKKK